MVGNAIASTAAPSVTLHYDSARMLWDSHCKVTYGTSCMPDRRLTVPALYCVKGRSQRGGGQIPMSWVEASKLRTNVTGDQWRRLHLGDRGRLRTDSGNHTAERHLPRQHSPIGERGCHPSAGTISHSNQPSLLPASQRAPLLRLP